MGVEFCWSHQPHGVICKQLIYLVTTNYATKWVGAMVFITNIVATTTKFMHKWILTSLGAISTWLQTKEYILLTTPLP
jgi:hypothetical protein